MYDLAIIGGGPAGVAAGVYAARKRLNTIFIAETIGGQSTDSVEIQNWIGTEKISGLDLAKALEAHLRAYAGEVVALQIGARAEQLQHIAGGFSIQTSGGKSYEARAVLVAAGGSRKKLLVPGAAEFENKGVTYCASCDGPLFAGQDVAVVGGGNAGFETAAQLLAYCKSVTLIHRHKNFDRADAATVGNVLAHPNMRVLLGEPVEIKGGPFVKAVVVNNKETGEQTELSVAALFVEIGMTANTQFAQGVVALDEWGRIKVDGKSQRASAEGVWAAGDCSDGLYHQNNIAAGDAVKALEDIFYWLKSQAPAPSLQTPLQAVA